MTPECDLCNDAGQEMESLVESLCLLLEEQRSAGREGDLTRVEQLGEQGGAIVAAIARREGGTSAIPQARRRELMRSYEKLTLLLRAEQADVQDKMKQLRKVKRVVEAYRMDR
jgi:hypothetical protein